MGEKSESDRADMMIRFKQFLTEISVKQYLYHNTGLTQLPGILHYNAIGETSVYNPESNRSEDHAFDYITGKPIKEKLHKGWVSFTRDKNYHSAPGNYAPREVRFVFDYEILKQRYKIRPYANLFVASSKDRNKLVKGPESRWESEELVYGPVYLKHGLVAIELSMKAFNQLKAARDAFTQYRDEALENVRLIPQGKVILDRHNIYYKSKDPVSLDERPGWRKRFTVDKFKKSAESWQKHLDDTNKLLNHPRLTVGNI